MRRVLHIALPLLALSLAACPGKKPKDGTCASDKECAAQEGFGKICVQGRCQECGQDTDCPAGFACRDNKCAPRAECDESRPCPGGKACQAGRCVTEAAPPTGGDGGGTTTPPVPACTLERIGFDFDAATLSPEARDALAKDAECLKQKKAQKVSIEGHCDERGTNEYNQHLGQRRAESVRRYLSNLGLSTQMDAVSYGEEQPACSEKTEDCWKQNRRVELKAQ